MLVPDMPRTVDDFKAMVGGMEAGQDYQRPAAFALGLATVEGFEDETRIIDVRYTRTNYDTNFGTAAVLAAATDQTETGLQTGEHLLRLDELALAKSLFTPFLGEPGHANIDTLAQMNNAQSTRQTSGESVANRRMPVLGVVRNWDEAPVSVADAYLRLYALSQRVRQPNTINLDGIFGILPNVVITEQLGTFTPEKWNKVEEEVAFKGHSTAVRVLDKFPRMLDHVVPSGVRVADPSRVRLGAHLGEGTTVMHEGFVNFNAGTAGPNMVEGRISQGVFVGADSDIGGGASIMGTLSGGGKEVIRIGERSLLGANSGIGISIGDDCVVEAGLYLTAGSKVNFDGRNVKAIDLSGSSGLRFIRNSVIGSVEATRREGKKVELNPALHSNQ